MLENILIILDQFFLYLPLMLGSYISFSLLKVPNFSIEGSFVAGAIFSRALLVMLQDVNQVMLLFALSLASVIGGVCVGALVASLVTYGKIPHLLANVLAIGLCYGINLYLLGASNASLSHLPNPLFLPMLHNHPELITVGILSIFLLGFCVLLFKTQLGYSIAIYGNNPLFFQHYGISTAFVVSAGLMIANGLTGLSGYLVAQSSGFIDINAGSGLTLLCVTVLVLGKSLDIYKQNISVFVPVVGLMIYCLLQQLMLKVGFNLKYFTLIQSLVVLSIILYQYRNKRASEILSDQLGV